MAAEKPEKKEKKDKKRSDESGVSKPKKEKKDKKEKKEKLAAAIEEKIQQDAAVVAKTVKPEEDSDMDDEETKAEELPLERTVVPFAVPVADEKGMKKVYKTIRKGKSLRIPRRCKSFQLETSSACVKCFKSN